MCCLFVLKWQNVILSHTSLFRGLNGGLYFNGGEEVGDFDSNIFIRESTLGESGALFKALSTDRPKVSTRFASVSVAVSILLLTTLGTGTGPVGGWNEPSRGGNGF